jgi:hypothetical protein
MIRWLRVVLPSLDSLVIFPAVYGCAVAFMAYLETRFGVRLPEARVATRVALGCGPVVYAIWRVMAFHPVFYPPYRRWLAATPWTSRRPLPMGPIHLVPQDVILIGAFVLLGWLCEGWALFVPQCFLAVYLSILALSLFLTGAWPWGYTVAFGLSVVVCLWRDIQACFIAEAVSYAAGYLGVRQSLARFPWDTTGPRDFIVRSPTTGNIEIGSSPLGWPFGRLAPKFDGFQPHVPLHHALLVSLLVGSWAFAIVSYASDREDVLRHVLTSVLIPFALLTSLIRVCVYCDGYLPPISLLGRLATGRWIIPGYDQVFLPAIVVGAVSCVLVAIWTFLLELNPFLYFAVTVAVVLFITLGMGPSLKTWRLTGNHRIVEGSRRQGGVKVG